MMVVAGKYTQETDLGLRALTDPFSSFDKAFNS